MSFNFSILGQLTPLEATPPTPSTPLIPQSIVGTNSPQPSTGVGGLPSHPHPIHPFAQAQPLSLEEEIKQFEKKYKDLVNCVLSSFKTEGVSIRRVLNYLRQLPVSLKLRCGEFLQSQAARLSRASSIDELFFILSPYWDFLNPSLLAYLAHRFSDDETIRLVDEYLAELKEFRMQTKINKFIDKWTGRLLPDTQEIFMKLGDDWREQSLEELEELRIEVSCKGSFEDSVMPLKSIRVSSVDAIYSPPLDQSLAGDVVSMVSNVLQQIQQGKLETT